MPPSPTIALNDGHHIPRLGFGVWRLPDGDAPGVVGAAIKAGYRHVDTAQGYDNEEGVGRAVREAEVSGSELFIPPHAHGRHYEWRQLPQTGQLSGRLSNTGLGVTAVMLTLRRAGAACRTE